MKIRIEPYKTWSGGAKALGLRAGILRATDKQVRKYGNFDIIINWGNTEKRFQGEYLNAPENVACACNKKTAMVAFQEAEVPTSDFTTDKSTATKWWEDGDTVLCRRLLRASAGRGIVLASKEIGQEIVPAPLYTKYVKKATEYRVHVFNSRVIDAQQKRKRQEVENDNVNYQIRNSNNGWVYCRGGIELPAAVSNAALCAVQSLGLDFGAVDIGWNHKQQKACVYEVNTAPGLEGTTLNSYYAALLEKYPVLSGGMYLKRRYN